MADGFALEVFIVRADVVFYSGDFDFRELSRAAVGYGESLVEVVEESLGRLPVHSDLSGWIRAAAYVEHTGNIALGVLVGNLDVVGTHTPVDGGGGTVSDAVIAIAELRTSDGRVVRLLVVSCDDLSHNVILIIPFVAVFKDRFGALVQGIISVAVR